MHHNNFNPHEDFRNRDFRKDFRDIRRKTSDENPQINDEKVESNIFSKLSNIFQHQKYDKPEQDVGQNDEISKTLATLLTLPTNKLEETMNNELNTQQSHINSEYFYLFYLCESYVCLSMNLRTLCQFKYVKKIRKFLNFNFPKMCRMTVFLILLLSFRLS